MRVYDIQARVRFPVPPAVVEREIPPTVGVIERPAPHATSTTVVMGGDVDWLARYLAGLPFPFEVLSPDAVRDEVAAHARRLLAYADCRGARPGAPLTRAATVTRCARDGSTTRGSSSRRRS